MDVNSTTTEGKLQLGDVHIVCVFAYLIIGKGVSSTSSSASIYKLVTHVRYTPAGSPEFRKHCLLIVPRCLLCFELRSRTCEGSSGSSA